MQVIDLPAGEEQAYFTCLQEWSDEMAEAGDYKQAWYRAMQDRGIRVKVSVDDDGVVGGMIHCAPIENVAMEGHDLYYTYCVWVHGHKKGRGDYQGTGMGTALLRAAEDDVEALGGKGLVVWGVLLPFFMKASWFRKRGYVPVDRDGMTQLLWKPFTDDAEAPRFVKRRRPPARDHGTVTVTCFRNGWCPAQNLVYERAHRAAAEIGEPVRFIGIDTIDRETALDWGVSDGLFIDGQEVRTGPPPGYDTIKRAILKRLARLAGDR